MRNERVSAEEILLAQEESNAAEAVSYGVANYGIMTLCEGESGDSECDSGSYDDSYEDNYVDDSECEADTGSGIITEDDIDDSECCGDGGGDDSGSAGGSSSSSGNGDSSGNSGNVGNNTQTGNTKAAAIELGIGETDRGYIADEGDEVWYKFTPGLSAYYTISTTGSLDTMGCLYDANGKRIKSDDDSGTGYNFKMRSSLDAGQTYYIRVSAYEDNTGYFNISIERGTVFVETVSLDLPAVSMVVGESRYIAYDIYPICATNKLVKWSSSNTSVATVTEYAGEIVAMKAGQTTITITTDDGSFTAECVVTVAIDRVTIKKDGAFNKVVFEKSGKTWLCINHDRIYSEEKSVYEDELQKRSNYNFFTYCDDEDMAAWDMTPKEYSDDEIRLLYVIDPYGVADYVRRYADTLDGLKNSIQHKDEKFELLYGRKPKYFARTLDDVWYETTYTGSLVSVVSESETLFGMHILYDLKTMMAIFDCCITVVGLLCKLPIFAEGERLEKIGTIVKVAVEVVSVGEATLKNELLSYKVDSIIGEEFEKTSLEWPNDMVSLYDSLSGVLDAILAEPNLYSDILNYCAYDTNYLVYVQLRNGERHRIEDICVAINN